MTKTKREPDPISRAFRQDFPQFADRAKSLDVRISLSPGKRGNHDRVFWLDGYKQLTGYTTRSDGSMFTHDDAVQNIDRALTALENDRALVATMTVAERFDRIMAEMRQIKPQHRMICEVRMPNGDGGHCFFMAAYSGGVALHGIGDVARAEAPWCRGESDVDYMAQFCDRLCVDFRRRQAESDATS